MNIFTLTNSGTEGTLVNRIKTVTWIERYLEGGEFTITGTDVEYLRKTIPIDTLISHSETYEIMIVEEHVIDETLDEGPVITITGRGLEQFMMENRVVTGNGTQLRLNQWAFPGRGYSRSTTSRWDIAKKLIEDYLKTSIEDSKDNMANFNVRSLFTEVDDPKIYYRWENMPTVYEAVLEVLRPQSLGIKVERPNDAHTTLDFVIHNGVDLSDESNPDRVEFSWFMGEIKKARYLWSSRGYKNAMFVYDSMMTHRSYPSVKAGIDRRVGTHDATSSEWPTTWTDPPSNPLSNAPTGAELTTNAPQIAAVSNAARHRMKRMVLIDAEIGQNARLRYMHDYNMGDLVRVIGKYDVSQPMRVTEYALTLDETGVSGYPTLTDPTEVEEE